jgi:hypothetical protein
MSTADELFTQLDGQSVGNGGCIRRIEVEGIREADNRFWVQLELIDGDDVRPLVLNLGATVSASTALASIEEWLANPDAARGQVIVVD